MGAAHARPAQPSVAELLWVAAQEGRDEVVRALLPAVTRTHGFGLERRTVLSKALSIAVVNMHSGTAEVLLRAKANANWNRFSPNRDGADLLYLAALAGDTERAESDGPTTMLELLLRFRARVDQIRDCFTPSAVWAAADAGHANAICMLAQAGADVDIEEDGTGTPICVAANRGHASATEALVRAKANPNRTVRFYQGMHQTPATNAALGGHADVLEVLARAKADMCKAPRRGFTAAYAAALRNHGQALRVLALAGADLNAAGDTEGTTPMICAVKHNCATAISVLAELKVDVDNVRTQKGDTLACLAAERGFVDALAVLAAAKADLDRPSDSGETSAFSAALGDRASALLFLAQAKANLDLPRTHDGMTPVHVAAATSASAALDILVQAKAALDTARCDGCTPALCAAAYRDSARVLLQLHCAKADVSRPMPGSGWTPLTLAAATGDWTAVLALLTAVPHLARVHTAGEQFWNDRTVPAGATPAQVASLSGHADIAQRLALCSPSFSSSSSSSSSSLSSSCASYSSSCGSASSS